MRPAEAVAKTVQIKPMRADAAEKCGQERGESFHFVGRGHWGKSLLTDLMGDICLRLLASRAKSAQCSSLGPPLRNRVCGFYPTVERRCGALLAIKFAVGR
jgi:hypothetical protein